MTKVHVLDENTINKIAAGEVVERPSSVVKELVENAVDAGAKRIEVEIMAGGTSFIRVTDDGSGMSMENARTAILRHATSKIEKIEDIERIDTLGFRGEALPTIAAVSHFSLLTRQSGDELGTSVLIDGGKISDIREAGCNIGTTVKVEDLFYNTPARKKFLKTVHTEGNKINELLIKLALARADIRFQFVNNNKMSVVTPGNSSVKDTAQSVYGKQLGDSLLELNFSDTDLKITGFISKPSMIRSSRTWQTFIVNGRIVTNKAIAKAIDNAYHSLLPKAGFPFAVLFIDVPPQSIDVNVHPQKLEIKFDDEGRIFKAVYKSVIDAIRSVGANLNTVAAVVQKPERHFSVVSEPLRFNDFDENVNEKTQSVKYDVVPFSKQGGQIAENKIDFQTVQSIIRNEKAETTEQVYVQQSDRKDTEEILYEEESPVIDKVSQVIQMTPLGQVGLCFIIARDADGLYIIDQHAAHERIMYDKFAAMAENIPVQQLLMHPVLQFAKTEAEIIEKYQELFLSLGFELVSCGEVEYRLISVPSDVPVSEAEDVVREILQNIVDHGNSNAAEIRHHCLATTACRAAIKAGDELNLRQMQIIIDELAHTARPYTCPHGRPTILKFSTDELAKMFKRT